MLVECDVAIIGGGPAGLAAGLFVSRARLRTLIIEKGRIGGQAVTTEEIENYPGFRRGTKATELMDLMARHARDFGAEIIKDTVVELKLKQSPKFIRTKWGMEIFCRTVILAPGARPRMLGVKGELQFQGRGVSYCATCDANFFENLEVVVVGSGDAALEEAIYLARIARKVSIVAVHDEGVLDASKIIQEKIFKNDRINVIWNSRVVEITGDELVRGVILENIKTGGLSNLACDGVFIFAGTVPCTDFLRECVELDNQGYIITDERMATSVEGVFAAGDARKKYLYQVITAASDGAIAAYAASKYLEEEEIIEDLLGRGKPVAVLFWTPAEDVHFNAVSLMRKILSNFGWLESVKIDAYKNRNVAKRMNVQNVPCLVLIENGNIKGSFDLSGKDEEAVKNWLRKEPLYPKSG